MRPPSPFVAAVTTAWIACTAASLDAQASGTVDAGSSWIDYEGFLGSGAAFLSPTLQYHTPNTSFGASGSYVLFESGRYILQGLAAGAWRRDLGGGFLGEISGSAGFNVYDESNGFGHLLARTRLHYTGRLSGAWLGVATGRSFQQSTGSTPYEVELGGWLVHQGVGLSAIATRSWNAGIEYLDIVGTARWKDRFLEIDGSLGLRDWSDGGGQGVYGELNAQIPLWKRLSAAIAGGRYPSDHVRGALSANFVNVSLSLATFGTPTKHSPTQGRMLLNELERPGEPVSGEARLTVRTSLQDLHTIRITAPGTELVELTADFTDWRPITLRQVGDGVWQVTLTMVSGVHRVNVRLDGGSWQVPIGLRAEEDDFGGRVGLLVVR